MMSVQSLEQKQVTVYFDDQLIGLSDFSRQVKPLKCEFNWLMYPLMSAN